MAVKKRTHPTVNGVQTTFTALGKALKITAQGARTRYLAAQKLYGKKNVKSVHIAQAVVPPDRGMLKQLRNEQEANLKIVRFVLLHGPTHAAQEFNLPVEKIKSIMEESGV